MLFICIAFLAAM